MRYIVKKSAQSQGIYKWRLNLEIDNELIQEALKLGEHPTKSDEALSALDQGIADWCDEIGLDLDLNLKLSDFQN